jgi:hypothetical protein
MGRISMRNVPAVLIIFAVLTAMLVSGQDKAVQDLNALVGRQVIVQRMPLCEPGTYNHVLSYAGKQATVVSLKPFVMPRMPKINTTRLTPEVRAMMEDSQHMATILLKFEDGTQLDTCSAVLPSMLSNYLELVPGQKVELAVASATALTPPTGANALVAAPVVRPTSPQECPVTVTKATSSDGGFSHAFADALTKSQFERAYEKALNGGHEPHYLDVRMRNASQKQVRGIEAFVVYANIMGDQGETSTILSQNDKSIKPGGEYKGYSVDTYERWQNGKGDVTVYVNRIRFEDNTFWYDNGSHSCALTTQIKQ